MGEASVFDAYRAGRALDGQLQHGDALQAVAFDDISGVGWVLTKVELVLLTDGVISERVPLESLSGEVTKQPAGLDVRVRDDTKGTVLIAAFRRSNKFTDLLEQLLASR
jgi:hypothetical protein